MWFWIVMTWIALVTWMIDALETWYVFRYLHIKYPFLPVEEINPAAKWVLELEGDLADYVFILMFLLRSAFLVSIALLTIYGSVWFGLILAALYGGSMFVIISNLRQINMCWEEIEDQSDTNGNLGRALKEALKNQKVEKHGKSD
jgi:hypothetical protein